MIAWRLHLALCEAASPEGGRDDGIWLALIVLGLIVVVMSVGRMLNRKRRARSAEVAAPTPDRRDISRAAAGQLEELLRDVEDLAKEMNARLDTKIVTLEALVRQADERIAHLKSLSCGPDGEGEPAEGGRGESLRQGGTGTDDDERFADIYSLADEGLKVAEISRRTGVLAGEVELILGLRGRRGGGPA